MCRPESRGDVRHHDPCVAAAARCVLRSQVPVCWSANAARLRHSRFALREFLAPDAAGQVAPETMLCGALRLVVFVVPPHAEFPANRPMGPFCFGVDARRVVPGVPHGHRASEAYAPLSKFGQHVWNVARLSWAFQQSCFHLQTANGRFAPTSTVSCFWRFSSHGQVPAGLASRP